VIERTGEFRLVSDYEPRGDQPRAIADLVEGIGDGLPFQTLLGVTGSGKTFTIANVIEQVQRPTLIIAHNKTLAAQLASEFREFFPANAVEYFVSYYDYFQPEAYIPQSDTYIEKDASINDEIDRLRHSATHAVLSRRDVVVVASVSCIFGLGSPEEYSQRVFVTRVGDTIDREQVLHQLVDIHFARNDLVLSRGSFRVRGDVLEIQPADEEKITRIQLFGDEVERITTVDPLTGEVLQERREAVVFPATHYVTSWDRLERAVGDIEKELEERVRWFKEHDKPLEAERIWQRTKFDIEMLREVGYCNGVENYSRHLDGRAPGTPPSTLVDFFPDDFLLIIDESHQSVPQINAMHKNDRTRKEVLIEYGFRLPSALDNRPLTFVEFESRLNQVIFTSATPGPYEREHSHKVAEQVVRPTGLVDPEVEVRPTAGQIDDLISEVNERVERGERTLVTTLTKRMAEDLSGYLADLGMKVHYLHSEIQTLRRSEILRDLRLGEHDVIVGINLLREGLDLPEVSLVAILDADKEGFLRSETSLIQTMGRAARNVSGKVIMYADEVTGSMTAALDETQRRREIQRRYNVEHGITPETVRKEIRRLLIEAPGEGETVELGLTEFDLIPEESIPDAVAALQKEMDRASRELKFEEAAQIRDQIVQLRRRQDEDFDAEILRQELRPRRPRRRRTGV
jgi:excinuclease ABC subunit B